jgi:hypothetical protein
LFQDHKPFPRTDRFLGDVVEELVEPLKATEVELIGVDTL